MSFLVVINGQFTPLLQSTSPVTRSGTAAVGPVTNLHEVSEFKEMLEEKLEGHLHRTSPGIGAYQQASKKFEEQRKRQYARDIMSSPAKLISQNALAEESREILKKYGFRHLPVVNSNNVIIGMISDRETSGDLTDKRCEEIMESKVIVCEEHASINEIAIILLKEKINALPIINHKHEVTGIITLSDILRFVIDSTGFLGKG